MKVNGKDYSHILWKIKHVPNHQPGEQIVPWIRITAVFSVINLYIDRTFTYPTKIGQVLELYGVKHHVYGNGGSTGIPATSYGAKKMLFHKKMFLIQTAIFK